MATDTHTIRVLIEAKDSGYSSTVRKASQETKNLSIASKAMSGELSGVASGLTKAGLAGTASLGILTKSSMDFNKAMSNVNAALYGSADDTAESLSRLRDAALESGSAFGYSATETADAANELIRAGRSASDVVGGELRASLSMAAADNMDLAHATSIMASTMSNFAKSGVTAAQVADTLAAGAGVAQGGIGELGEALKYAGTQAAASGVSLEETTGLLATLANAGMVGSMAGTGLAGVMRNLQTPTSAAATALEELGVSAYDSEGKFRGVTTTIEDLAAAVQGMSQQERTEYLSKIFDVRSLNAVLPLIDAANTKTAEGTSLLRDMESQVSQSGYASEQAARQLDNLAGDAKKLGTALEQAFIGSSDGINSFARTAVQHLTNVVDAYNDLPSGAKNAVAGLTAVASGGALAVAGLIKGAEMVRNFSSALETMGVKATTASTVSKVALGGLGGALGIAGLAFSVFATYAANAQSRADAYTSAIENAADSTERAASAAEVAAKAFITGDNADWGWFQKARTGYDSVADALESYGFSAADAGKAVAGSQAEFEEFIKSFDEAVTSAGDYGAISEEVRTKLHQQRDALGVATEETNRLSNASAELGTNQDETATATDAAAEALEAEADAARQAAEDFDALIQSLFGVRDATSSMLGTRAGFEAAIDSAKEAVDAETEALLRNKDIYDLNNPAVREAESALRGIADSAATASKNLLENGGSMEQNTAIMEMAAASIMEQGKAWGLSTEELTRYASELTGVPEARVTELTVEGARTSLEAVSALESALTGVPTEITSSIFAEVLGGGISDVEALTSAMEQVPPEKRLDVLVAVESGEVDALNEALADVPEETRADILTLLDRSGIEEATSALEGIPDKVAQIDADNREAVLAAAEARGEISRVPSTKNTTITADGSQAKSEARSVKSYIDSIKSKSVTITATEYRISAGPAGIRATYKASGGAIIGPGTATSDDIPAMLSNGEHVLTAAEVSAMGGQDAVYRMRGLARAGMLKFADGGAVRYGRHTYDEWARLVKTPLEMNRLQLRINNLRAEINRKPKRGEKSKSALEKRIDRQELAELEQELKDSKSANWLNSRKSIEARIAAEDAKIESKRKAEEASQRSKQAAEDKRLSRHKEIRDLRLARNQPATLDEYDALYYKSFDSGLFSTSEGRKFRASMSGFEDQIKSLDALRSASDARLTDLKSTFEGVAGALDKFDLAGLVKSEWVTEVDKVGNVRSTLSRPTGKSIAQGAASQASKVKTLSTKIKALVSAGASPALIDHIVALPIDDAIATASSLLQDRDALATTNQAISDISLYSRQGAQYATEAQYSGGLAAAEAFAKELESRSAELGNAMANAFYKAIGGEGTLQARAGGGPVSAFTPYLVGERGPEVIVPAKNGTVVPNSSLGATTNNYIINGVNIDPANSAEADTIVDFVSVASRYARAGMR